MDWKNMVNWKKWKKVIIPVVIVKIIIFIYFIFFGDFINISRASTYGNNYQEVKVENDSIALKQQKLIRIVRNEEERGFTIIIRERENNKVFRGKQRETPVPIID
jgi:hypothetical protein